MNDLKLKTPQEEINFINKKLSDDNPIVDMRKIKIDDYVNYKGWELIRFCELGEPYFANDSVQNPHYGKADRNGNTDYTQELYNRRTLVVTDVFAIIGRREHSTCIDLKKQIDEEISKYKQMSSTYSKDKHELENQISLINKKLTEKEKEKDRFADLYNMTLEENKNLRKMKDNLEEDIGKLRKAFGEIKINDILTEQRN